jgi:hypothetical protein
VRQARDPQHHLGLDFLTRPPLPRQAVDLRAAGPVRTQVLAGQKSGKSGVSSSSLPEEMNRHGQKSGVSSSSLPEEMNRHGITRKDELTPDYSRKDELTPDY